LLLQRDSGTHAGLVDNEPEESMGHQEIVSDEGLLVHLEADECEWVYRAFTEPSSDGIVPGLEIDAEPFEHDVHASMEFGEDAMARVLDQLAAIWRASPVVPGSPVEVVAYEGWSILVEPDPAAAPTDSQVRLRWRLAPPPPPSRIDVSDEKAAEVRLGVVALEAAIHRWDLLCGFVELGEVGFGHEQPYGPMSAWVVANARAMVGLEHIDVLAVRMELVAAAENPQVASMALSMVAEPILRASAVAAIADLVDDVVGRIEARDDWQEAIRYRAADLSMSFSDAKTYLAEHLRVFVSNALASCALEDVIYEPLLLLSQGGWRSVVSPSNDDPGALWHCSEETASTLRRFFADMDEPSLTWAVGVFETPDHDELAYLRTRLVGSTLTRAASPPPLATVVGPGLADLLHDRWILSHVDHLARYVAALCEPPAWADEKMIGQERARLARATGFAW
jgi:hypothetical protein